MHPIIRNGWVSWKSTLAGICAFLIFALPQLKVLLNNPNSVDIHSALVGLAMLVLGWVTKDGDKSTEQVAGPAPTIGTGGYNALHMLPVGLCFGAILLCTGCATDQRVATANKGAANYENQCIAGHMAIHKVEQDSLAAAQFNDIQYKTNLSVHSAQLAAEANPKITPAMLVTDVARTFQEQQIMMNKVNANLRNLQDQINSVNQYHVAAQAVFGKIDEYNTTPDVTATAVATVATNALQGLVKPATATVVAPPDPGVSLPTATVAVPVPGQ